MHNPASIWQEISGWPPEQRRALATQLLQSLQRDEAPATVSKERQEALLKLIGIWKTRQAPSDEQVERILERERMKKYG
jgi:hypothetical protein